MDTLKSRSTFWVMNIMKQQTRVALAATVLVAAPALSMATPSTITFNGKVINQTCQVKVGGAAGNVEVKLPNVAVADLAAVNSTAGRTPFVVSIENCEPGVSTAVNTTLSNVTLTQNGTLQNMVVGGAQKVALQLLPDMSGNNPFFLSSVSHLSGLTLGPTDKTASHEFAVQYISHEGGATTGDVQAVVNYEITYP